MFIGVLFLEELVYLNSPQNVPQMQAGGMSTL
jgi:hypothetical protein